MATTWISIHRQHIMTGTDTPAFSCRQTCALRVHIGVDVARRLNVHEAPCGPSWRAHEGDSPSCGEDHPPQGGGWPTPIFVQRMLQNSTVCGIRGKICPEGQLDLSQRGRGVIKARVGVAISPAPTGCGARKGKAGILLPREIET